MLLAAAAAFNLVCSGTLTQTDKAPEPFTRTIHVNLDTKKYCEDACDKIQDIAEVQPARLIFRNVDSQADRTKRTDFSGVDRESGKYFALYAVTEGRRYFSISERGQCERAAFTEFPEFKTKF